MNRAFTNVLSGNVEATALFYERLLGMRRHFDSDWFVILTHDDMDGLEFGVLSRDAEIVPEALRAGPSGVLLTFVVEDVDAVHREALGLGAEAIEAPRDLPYGQRRMLVRDPDGTPLDVSAPMAPLV